MINHLHFLSPKLVFLLKLIILRLVVLNIQLDLIAKEVCLKLLIILHFIFHLQKIYFD